MAGDFDVVVVGAGAAGLAAARRLTATSLSVMVLEARSRIGGRAHSLTTPEGWGLDLGCGWLHSGNVNPFSRIGPALGFEIDKSPPPWMRQSGRQGFTAEEQAAFRQEFAAFEQRLEAAAATGEDRPAADLLTPASPWNHVLNAFSAFYNGAEFDQVSVLDYAAYQDTEVNWRAPAGYGALIAAFGAQAPVTLEAPATIIDHGGPRIRIETPKGIATCRAAIITLPSDLIAADQPRFDPPLPDKAQAAAGLPLGLADKLFLAVDGAEEFPIGGHLFGRIDRAETGSYHLRPFGRPLIEAYVGGRHARALEAGGPGALAAFAITELCELLGSSWRERLNPIAASAWGREAFSRGSYSHALPGRAGDRAILAAPHEGRLFFAGEATSPEYFSTAHGAYESGARAASEVITALVPGAEGRNPRLSTSSG